MYKRQVDIYTELVEQVLDRHAPIKLVKQHKNYQGGLSYETKQTMAARDNARKNNSEGCKNLELKL